MKKFSLALVALFTLSLFALAYIPKKSINKAVIEGTVIDFTTKTPIAKATISVYNGDMPVKTFTTTADGKYRVELDYGIYDFTIKANGYTTIKATDVLLDSATTRKYDFEMVASKEEDAVSNLKITEDKIAGNSSNVVFTDTYDIIARDDIKTIDYAASPVSGVTRTKATSAEADESIIKSAPGVVVSSSRYEKRSDKSTPSKAKGKAAIKDERKVLDVKGTKDIAREPDGGAGQLTAGEWCDNKNWDFYIDLRTKADWKSKEPYWGFDLGKRVEVNVVNGTQGVANVVLTVTSTKSEIVYTARTDNNGKAYLFPEAFIKTIDGNYILNAALPEGTKTIVLAKDDYDKRPVTINTTSANKAGKLDVMFMIDATGSMGDELSYIKEELNDVIRRVKLENEQMVDINVGAGVYRDQGDEYVVRAFPFTNSVSTLLTQLNGQTAGGGGDFPEAVEEALDHSVNKQAWRDDANTKLLFLILDAPPHYTPDRVTKIQNTIKEAAAKGIRVIPVASSGVDKDTEFLMRYFSIATGGTYVFLTDHSGIGNSHIEPTTGKYDVEYLNNLMVRVIKSYLATSKS